VTQGRITMDQAPTLHFLCGKVAAGKTTLARHLSSTCDAVLLCEDIWLDRLYPEEITDFDSYLKYSARLKSVVGPHVEAMLKHGISVVLDYPANTLRARAWIRAIFEAAPADHALHFVDTSNERCLEQLARRNQEKPEGSTEISVEQFEYITSFFVAPQEHEGFKVRVHRHGAVVD
jgi:predicted kinase